MSNVYTSPYKKLISDPRLWLGLAIVLFFIFCAVFAPLFSPTPPGLIDITKRLIPPSTSNWFGFDYNGGHVLTALLYGTRVSLFIGFTTVFLSVFVGIIVGTVSGYFGGRVDAITMRVADVFMAFPGILLALSLLAVLGPSLKSIILAISITGWTSTARIVRAQVLTLKNRDYVSAAKLFGAKHLYIMRKHIVPLIWSPVIIHATFSVSGVIIIEASLSFLGLGATDGSPSWGALLNQGKAVLEEAPHLSFFPGIAIVLIVLSLNFIGDSLRDALDPKSQ